MSLVADTPCRDASVRPRDAVVPRYACHAALAFGLALFVISRSATLLGDPDTQWHIAVGRWIVAHGSVPTTDAFSFTFAGHPWIAKEWVSQLLLYFAYDAGGWRGVVLLTAVAVSASFTGLFAWLATKMRMVAALALTLGAFALCEIHLLARPHMLVMPVMVAWLIVVVSALDRRTVPPLPAALLMTAWANMHGSFPLGLVLAGVLAGEAVVFAPPAQRVATARRWAIFLAAAAVATTLSPFGWRAILVPLAMFGNNGTLRFVQEWAPLGFDTLGAIAGYMLFATAALLLLDARRNAFRILAAALVAYLMVRHVRFVSLFGLIGPILVARTLALHLPRILAPTPIPTAGRRAILVALAALGLAIPALALARDPQPAAEVTPQAAYDAALAHGAHGNVYNDYDFGGFLIAHQVKTFIDGRTDQLFLGDFMPDLVAAIDAKDDAAFDAIVAKAQASWALIRPRSKTSAHFDRLAGWTRVYEDEHSAAYVRR